MRSGLACSARLRCTSAPGNRPTAPLPERSRPRPAPRPGPRQRAPFCTQAPLCRVIPPRPEASPGKAAPGRLAHVSSVSRVPSARQVRLPACAPRHPALGQRYQRIKPAAPRRLTHRCIRSGRHAPLPCPAARSSRQSAPALAGRAARSGQVCQRALRRAKKAATPSGASSPSHTAISASMLRATVSASMRGPRLRASRLAAATAPGAVCR